MDRKKQLNKSKIKNNGQNISNIKKPKQNIKNYQGYPTYNKTMSNPRQNIKMPTQNTIRPEYPTYKRQNQYNAQSRQTYQNTYTNTYSSRYNNAYSNQYSKQNSIQTKKIYRAKPKPKNRNLTALSKIFAIFTFIVIISYFGVSIVKSMNKKPIDYDTIEYGSIEDVTQVKGIIIRDEIVYKTTKTGIVNFNVAENQRVKKGEVIATIKNEDAIKTVEQDVSLINEKILALQKQRDELSIFYEDVKRIDSQMQKTIDNSINNLSTQNINKIYELKDNLNKKITIRNQMLLSENTGSVEQLSSQKADKEVKINQNTENLITNDSGILYYSTDGLEQTFTFETKDNLTKEQTLMQPEASQEYKINVVEGENVFKIVRDNNFYIASYIKNEYISSWQQNETRKIYISDEGTLKTLEVIVDKIEKGEKESYVLLKCNRDMIDFINVRNITFEINKPKEGFKIKLTGVSEEDLLKIPMAFVTNNNVIKKTQTGETIETPVKLSGQDETNQFYYVAISPGVIDIGDYIINPQTNQEIQLNEIFTKKGIYVVNSGIYTFKNIDTQDSVQNDQFIILDPNKNTNIKLYDRYAPDISVVRGDETAK